MMGKVPHFGAIMCIGAVLGANALRLGQRYEGGDFLTMSLTRISRHGFPSVYAINGDLGDLDSAANMFLVDSGSSTLTVEPQPKQLSLLKNKQWKHHDPWTVRYEATSMEGTTESGCFCIGRPPAQACTGKNFAFFQATSSDAALMGSTGYPMRGILGLAPVASMYDNVHDIGHGVLEEMKRSGTIKRKAFAFGAHGSDPQMHLGGWDPSRAQGVSFFPLAEPSRGKWEINLEDLLLQPAAPPLPDTMAAMQTALDTGPADGVFDKTAKPMNLCPGGGCRALIDTGTSLLEVSDEALAALQKLAPVKEDCSNMGEMPDLQVAFGGGKTFTIPAAAYIGRVGRGMCQLGVNAIRKQHWAEMSPPMEPPMLVLGELFIFNHYTIFDAEEGRIGIAP